MAEEHGFQSSENHQLCANNCGFFGSPATQNLCSKCYMDLGLKKTQKISSSGHVPSLTPCKVVEQPSSSTVSPPQTVAEPVAVQQQQRTANRCSTCRKKVGLTGFACRCGITFCGTHRYPERHGCTFDYKAAGKEAIAMANPVVKAEKLQKI